MLLFADLRVANIHEVIIAFIGSGFEIADFATFFTAYDHISILGIGFKRGDRRRLGIFSTDICRLSNAYCIGLIFCRKNIIFDSRCLDESELARQVKGGKPSKSALALV